MRKITCLVLMALTFSVPVWPAPPASAKPKLVLALVIDQFRADYITRFESRFLPARSGKKLGGFKYLMSQGAWYPYGEYDTLQSLTGPGHATILSGSYPYLAGIPNNNWYDSEKQERMYCTQDHEMATVGATPRSRNVGTSPKNFIGTTVGDELKNAGHSSRVVSIAFKDRSAILLGGKRADLALWMDPESFQWVSSRYYLPEGKLPAWVGKLNDSLTRRKGEPLTWQLPKEAATGLSLTDSLIGPMKWSPNFKTSFPHEARFGDNASGIMPLGPELTLNAAVAAIGEYKLGRGKSTDVLAVSLSSHDYLGHTFGPNSRELEEMTVAEDRLISDFLNRVNASLPGGLSQALIVLTGDHGVSPNPDWLNTVRIPAGRIDDGALAEMLESRLNDKFGRLKDAKWIGYAHDLTFYLNHRSIRAGKKDLAIADVELEIKNRLSELPSLAAALAYVVTRSDVEAGRLPPGMIGRQVRKTFFPGRSGNVTLVPRPFFAASGDTATHMTGYSYDRTVPILMAGPGIKPGRYPQKAEVADIAPTLTYLLGILPPSLSEGRVLSEAIGP